jgi:hypothetical protein
MAIASPQNLADYYSRMRVMGVGLALGWRGSGSRMAWVWLSDGVGLALRRGSISLRFCGYAIARGDGVTTKINRQRRWSNHKKTKRTYTSIHTPLHSPKPPIF